MATILRVKRKVDSQPEDTLIISKRLKLENDEEEATVPFVHIYAKFTETIKDPNENLAQRLATFNKEELKANFKKYVHTDIREKLRSEMKEKSVESRYKFLGYQRSMNMSEVEESENKQITIIDLEDLISTAANKDESEEQIEDTDYVYDLYYMNAEDTATDYNKTCISVYAFNENNELVCETYRDDSDPEDSEDSNAESYWRNDYGDKWSSDSNSSNNEDDGNDSTNSKSSRSKSDELSSDEFVEEYNPEITFKREVMRKKIDNYMKRISGLALASSDDDNTEDDNNLC